MQSNQPYGKRRHTLRTHNDDHSIPAGNGIAYGVGCWPMEGQEGLGFRYFRILTNGNNSGGDNRPFCSGLEFWGTLTDTTPA